MFLDVVNKDHYIANLCPKTPNMINFDAFDFRSVARKKW